MAVNAAAALAQGTEGQRRRGRPPKPDKRVPLSLLVHPALRGSLVTMAGENGRSLTQQTELLLERGVKDPMPPAPTAAELVARLEELARGFEQLAHEVGELRQQLRTEKPVRKSKRSIAPRDMYRETGGPGQPGRLVPVEISIVRRDDGSAALVRRRDGLVIGETPLDIATAQRLAGELLAASGSAQKRAVSHLEGTTAASGQKEEPASAGVTPASRKTAGSSDGGANGA